MRPRSKSPEQGPSELSHIDGPRIGRVVAFRNGEARVDFDGNALGPVRARVASTVDVESLARAADSRQDAVLIFADGDPRRPVLLALLRSDTPLVDAILQGSLPSAEKTARVDGQRVEIEGREEVLLRCGKATLTLRRDGKVVLRGVEITTQADRVQRIRGGKVQIN
jgi:hypothetical protein